MLRSARNACTMPRNAQLKLLSRLPRRDTQRLPVQTLQQLGLARGHRTGASVVIVAEHVQDAVHEQHGHLQGQRQPVCPRLALRHARAHDHVAEEARRRRAARDSGGAATSPASSSGKASTSVARST